MPTLKSWVRRHPQVKIKALHPPYETREEGGVLMDKYTLQLVWEDGARSRTSPEFPFRSGIGNRLKPHVNARTGLQDPTVPPVPDLLTVLDCLISDAAAAETSRSFDEFARDLGYDSDSRKAEAAFIACMDTLKWLTEFVGGPQEMNRLIYETDRL